MLKKQHLSILIVLLFLGVSAANAQENQDSPAARAEYERKLTADPKTGIVPRNELENSRNIMSKMIKIMDANIAIPSVTWAERGPNNIGGRTRAIMWDPNDATKKKVWAGGVTGGLWFNNDVTDANSSWNKVNDFWDNIAIGDIAYNPANTQIMYVGTGERASSSSTSNTGGSGGGGGGIWKTTNGGTTWTRLASTIPDYVNNTPAAQWREVFKVIVNAQGHIFVLGYWGIYRSTDGGTTWAALAGTNAPPATNAGRVSDMELGTDGILYVAEGGDSFPQIIAKSTDNTVTNFTVVTPPGATTNGNARVEIVLAPSTSGGTQVIYAVSASASAPNLRFFKKSTDAGTTWSDMAVPLYDDLNGGGEKPFVGNQGWYDLILGTHATNPNILYAAAITYSVSTNGGTSWLPKMGYSAYQDLMHVDNHAFAARPGFPNEAIFGNDGGVYYANDWATSGPTNYPAFQKRNKNYNVTQYFSVDINGVANNSTAIGGTQDNGTHTLTSPYGTAGSGFSINGGDGGLCFIDKLDSNIVISAYVNVTPKINTRGPLNNTCYVLPDPCDYVRNLLSDSNRGQFINPADYDSPNHTLYHNYTLSSETDSKIIRYHIAGTSPNYTVTNSTLTLQGQGALNISFIKLGKTQGSLYIGTTTGDVFKVTGINLTGNQTLSMTKIMDNTTTSAGNVSSIDFGTTENTIIVTKSNYNIVSVHYTTNGGTTWVSKDETGQGLPNIPIRYALINPVDTKQVLLATELGVWSTTDITAANPQWTPTNTSLANVRCDMLKFRANDNTVAVATHGRGIFTTKINQTTPCPTVLVLIDPTDNQSTGLTTFQASGTISASNKISGNADVTMKAANQIDLKPSTNGGGTIFEALKGTVFRAFIQGCAN